MLLIPYGHYNGNMKLGNIRSHGWSLAIVPTIWKTGPFEIPTFLSKFQIVFDKMATIFPDFKWLGFSISDPEQNPDNLKPNLFLTFQNPD